MYKPHIPFFDRDITRRTFGGAVLAVGVAATTGCTNPAEAHHVPSELPTNLETLSGQEALSKLYEDVSMTAMVARTMLSDQAPAKTIHLKEQSAVNTLDMLDVRFQRDPDALSLAAAQIRKGEGPNKGGLELLCTIGTIDPSLADASTSGLTSFLSATQISWVITDRMLVAEIRSGRKSWSELLQIMADPKECGRYMKLDMIDTSKDDNLSYIRRPLEGGISIEVNDTRTANPTHDTLYPTQNGFSTANTEAQALNGNIIKKVTGA